MADRHAELAHQLQESSQRQKEQNEQYKALQVTPLQGKPLYHNFI